MAPLGSNHLISCGKIRMGSRTRGHLPSIRTTRRICSRTLLHCSGVREMETSRSRMFFKWSFEKKILNHDPDKEKDWPSWTQCSGMPGIFPCVVHCRHHQTQAALTRRSEEEIFPVSDEGSVTCISSRRSDTLSLLWDSAVMASSSCTSW